MHRYKQTPAIVLLVIGIALMMMPSVPRALVLVMLAAAAVLMVFASRSSYYFNKASKIIRTKEVARFPEAVGYLNKAIDAGLPDDYLVIAASVLMQYGDKEKARTALVPLLDSKKKQTAALAKITLSMYYFVSDDIEEAIRLCESARDDDGSADRNLYVNLAVYYLRAGDRKNYRKTVKDAVSRYPSSPAVVDSQAILYMLDGRWDLAGATLFAIFDTISPSFADPYVHMAMVHMHYGEIGKARKELEKAEATLFTNISVYDPEDYGSHYNAIKDSWRIFKIMFKYLLSSISSLLVDMGIFYLIMRLFAPWLGHLAELVSTVVARACSSFVNFNANNSVVFHNKGSYKRSLLRYYCLCIPQMLVSAGLVTLINRLLGNSAPFIATLIKFAVDTCLFFLSYVIQREWVFKEK